MKTITNGINGIAIIGIDCGPMQPRPDMYIENITKILGIVEIPGPVSKSFGAWTWQFEGISEELWLTHKNEIMSECSRLYHEGSIRGAQHYWQSAIQTYIKEKVTLQNLYLMNLTAEEIRDLLTSEEDKRKFETDFEYAKVVVDETFEELNKI